MIEFYDIKHLMTYQRIFNFVVGNRTAGKSFSAKCMLFDTFFKKNKQFMYVRRYENELNLKTLFDDIIAIKYPNVKVRIEGQQFFKEIYLNDKLAGFGVALSKYDKLKTVSFVDVDVMLFDEFITENKRRYLKDEAECFLNLYHTVARGGGQVIRFVQAFFVGNAVSILNPFFTYFDIVPKKGITKTKSILIEMFENADVNNVYDNSQFGELIKNTKYGGFALRNEYYLDDYAFVNKENLGDYRLKMVFKYDTNVIGLWEHKLTNYYYCSKKINYDCPFKYCVRPEDFDVDFFLINKVVNKLLIKKLQYAFECGFITFENLQIKDCMLHVLNYLT